MKFLKEHKGFISGTHMAPIPVAPSDELQQLRVELQRMHLVMAAAVRLEKDLKDSLKSAHEKIAEHDAKTPWDKSKQENVRLQEDLILSRVQGRKGRDEFDGMTEKIQKLEAEVCFCLRDTPYYFG